MKFKSLLVVVATTMLCSCSGAKNGEVENFNRDIGTKITISEAKTIVSNLSSDTSKYSKVEVAGYCETYNITDGMAKQLNDETMEAISQNSGFKDLKYFTKVGDTVTNTYSDSTILSGLKISNDFINQIEQLNITYESLGVGPFYNFDFYANGNYLTLHLYVDTDNLSQILKEFMYKSYKKYETSSWVYYNEHGLIEHEKDKTYMVFNDDSIYDVSGRFAYNWVE